MNASVVDAPKNASRKAPVKVESNLET